MNSKKLTIVAMIVIETLLFVSSAQAAQYLVKYRNEFSSSEFQSPHFSVLEKYIPGRLYVLEIEDSTKVQAMIDLSTNPKIEYVVPNSRIKLFRAQMRASALREQWSMDKIQAQQAWQRAGNKGSRKITVAVVDTGADYKHVALAPNMVQGYNFVENNNDPMDIVSYGFPGHGTHCSGIIGATGLIDQGTTGISPEVSVMPLRFINDQGGAVSDGIRAIDYAISKKVDVISASWGGTMTRDEAQPLIEVIARAEAAGIVFVTAANNDGKDNDNYEVYPANAGLTNTISVAASDRDDSKPDWSDYGHASVSLAAPGSEILSTLPGNWYADMDGTSMSTPLVAGLVALVKAQDPSLTPMQLRSVLQASGDSVNIESACDCRVNALKAVDQVVSRRTFISPYGATLKHQGEQLQFEEVYAKGAVTYSSLHPEVASIDASGKLTAVSGGVTRVTATDATGATATSYKIYVETSLAPKN